MERATQMAGLSSGPMEYRLESRGPRAVLMLHGGHMRAGLPLGEEAFAEAGYTILAPSRPGYGRTPALLGGCPPERCADMVAELCDVLGLRRLAAVVGQSAGGPPAVSLAARHPILVQRLILQSAVGPVPWPDRRTRWGGGVVFHPRIEAVTWSLLHAMTRQAPRLALRLLLPELTCRPVTELLADLDTSGRASLLDLFSRMRSSAGFLNDLRVLAAPDRCARTAADASLAVQPALVIAAPSDGSVSYAHAEALTASLPNARSIDSRALSHMIWLGADYPDIAAAMLRFLALRPGPDVELGGAGGRA
ncbi:alpha/beta hydrolase [Actinocorallia longicatena]|uniref:Alpha/beta hydrolase n=1 Tax=Actinocorallia longicatena TaxID=111803 RepID=A0ABP6QF34_9ACTN